MWQSWLNAHDSKSCIQATVSRVRIPPSPPGIKILKRPACGAFLILTGGDGGMRQSAGGTQVPYENEIFVNK